MNIDKYTNEEIVSELAKAENDKAYYETQDKRLKSVKRELFWANAIITRDKAELERRGVAYA